MKEKIKIFLPEQKVNARIAEAVSYTHLLPERV